MKNPRKKDGTPFVDRYNRTLLDFKQVDGVFVATWQRDTGEIQEQKLLEDYFASKAWMLDLLLSCRNGNRCFGDPSQKNPVRDGTVDDKMPAEEMVN